jgi:hypothetical protein
MTELLSSEKVKYGDSVMNAMRFIDEEGYSYGVKHINNKPRVSDMPYLYDVAEGNVPGHSSWEKYAINDDVDLAAEEDVWCVGGNYVFPAAKMGMEVVSSSVEDDADKAIAGTGVHSIRIYYLTDDFTEKTEDLNLDGTTVVPTIATDIFRINRIRPLTVGTGLKAAGNIDVRHLDNSPIYTRIAAGFTKGRQLIYTVPKGKVLYITRFSGSIGGTDAVKYARFTLRSTWDNVAEARNAWMTVYAETGTYGGFFTLPLDAPMRFPAGSDIVVSAKSLHDNCYVTASLRGWLEAA